MHILNIDAPTEEPFPGFAAFPFKNWRSHGEQVAHLARDIAQELGLSDGAAARVEKAARRHDIGKSRLPELFDNAAMDATVLSRSERELLESHTWLGYRILQNDPNPDDWVSETALLHHERWDGTGYPLGLAQSDIPLAARIVSIADEYSLLLEHCPHPSARHLEDALMQIKDRAGTQFDPECVDALTTLTGRSAAEITYPGDGAGTITN